MDATTTRELVRRFQQGDRATFDVLYARFYPRLRLLARCRLPAPFRGKLSSEDLVQSSFIEALTHLDRFSNYRSDGLFLQWLSTILMNKLRDRIDHHTAGKRDVRREEPPASSTSALGIESRTGPLEGVIRQEELERLELCLLDLEESAREVLLLRWFCEMTWEELGASVGISGAAAQQRGLRAQVKLASAWHRRFPGQVPALDSAR